jgi:protein-tyrosine-phosphatase
MQVKLWKIVVGVVAITLLFVFGVGMVVSKWKEKNKKTIEQLNIELQESQELYKQRERTIDSIISLQENEHKRALEAEARAEKAEKGLEAALERIKKIDKKERYEKDRIANLDSSEQFKLLRSNLNSRGR